MRFIRLTSASATLPRRSSSEFCQPKVPRHLQEAWQPVSFRVNNRLPGYWKHQFGNHRVVYRIYPDHHIVVVCAVGVRKQDDAEDIYRQLESVAKTGRLAEQLASVLRNLLSNKK